MQMKSQIHYVIINTMESVFNDKRLQNSCWLTFAGKYLFVMFKIELVKGLKPLTYSLRMRYYAD